MRELQDKGLIRGTAEAVMCFDLKLFEDARSWRLLRNWVTWSEEISFDGEKACLSRVGANLKTPGGKVTVEHCRARAKGTFIVAGIPVSAWLGF